MICFLLIPSSTVPLKVFTQNKNIDSLQSLLAIENSDTAKVDLMLALSRQMYMYNLSKSKEISEEALELALGIRDKDRIIESRFLLGYAELELGDLVMAEKQGIEALSLAKELGDSLKICWNLNLLGLVHLRKNEDDLAIEYLFKAAKTSMANGFLETAASSYNNIGEIYNHAKDTANARKYYLLALEPLLELDDQYNLMIVYMNLSNMAESRVEKMEYLNRSINIGEEGNYPKGLTYSYATLGDILWQETGNLENAVSAYRSGLSYALEAEDSRMIIYNQVFLGAVFLDLGEIDSAEHHLESACKSEQLTKDLSQQSDCLYYYSKLLHSQGKYIEAYEYLDSSMSVNSRKFDADLISSTSEANARYEAQKKEAEIARQNLMIIRQKNTRKIIVGGSVLVLGLLGAAFYGIFQRIRRKKRESELELQLEKQRRQDMETLAKVKTEFFNNVSHELKTPLTLIWGPLKEAANEVRNVRIKENLNLAMKNSQRLLNLTNEILDLSRLEAGKLQIVETESGLKTFLHRILYSFSSWAESQQILLQIDADIPDDLSIRTDINKLEKILSNLISNAIKYSDQGGSVILRLDPRPLKDDGVLKLEVEDNGKGIPKNELTEIFERYYQSRMSMPSSGTGIGLSLVKQLCELLGGKISVESIVGKGSKFQIEIPLTVGIVKETERFQIPQKEWGEERGPVLLKTRKPTILLVEDDLDMAKYLKKIFEREYECQVAYNGIQALKMLKTRDYDLISSDVMMPELDGFQFREKLNGMDKYRGTPFILLTARSLEEDILRGLQLGVDDYITKPFSAAEIRARVKNLLRNKASREEILDEDPTELDVDSQFLAKAQSAVENQLENASYKIGEFALDMNYSERQLGRILKRLTGLTPVEFILELRLQKAYQMLRDRQFSTVSEVRYEVGIESASYFSTKFLERFGIKPSEVVPSF